MLLPVRSSAVRPPSSMLSHFQLLNPSSRTATSFFIFKCFGHLERFEYFLHLLWFADTPDSAPFYHITSLHSNFLSNQISPNLTRTNPNPSSHLFFLVKIFDTIPPPNSLNALPSPEILQLLLILKRPCTDIGNTFDNSWKHDKVLILPSLDP